MDLRAVEALRLREQTDRSVRATLAEVVERKLLSVECLGVAIPVESEMTENTVALPT